MVNWHDPAVVAADFEAFTKLQHVVGGIFIWEFVITLDYDWSYITGERSWKWTMWASCRLSILAAVILVFVGFDSKSELNCEAWIKFMFIFPYLGILFASALIAVRATAIWDRNIYILLLTVSGLLVQLGVLIRSVAVADARWDPNSNTCSTEDTTHSLPVMSATLAVDAVLLLCMFTGITHIALTVLRRTR
ncbi:hypothetical protein OF83DRAFT_1172084 [Amylostereum chailletii]|nr:hypothetical protein OF83DRAFT_1172084 [Amylostereum chailletii]